jgi:hypothetical protein
MWQVDITADFFGRRARSLFLNSIDGGWYPYYSEIGFRQQRITLLEREFMEIDDIFTGSSPPSLLIDSGTKLLIQIEGIASVPVNSYFVGMEVDEYIAIKYPTPFPTVKHKIFPGTEFIIRYLFKGSIYAFQTKVIDIITKPVRLVFLEFPKMVADRNIRSSKRTRAFIPGELKTNRFQSYIVIVDLSKKGCRLQFLSPTKDREKIPRKDDTISINCQFPGIGGEKAVQGIIRNFEKKKDFLTLGVEFVDATREFQNAIAQYILAVEEFA